MGEEGSGDDSGDDSGDGDKGSVDGEVGENNDEMGEVGCGMSGSKFLTTKLLTTNGSLRPISV